MDPAKFKTTTTSRGFTYYYYFVPAQGSKPDILFLHGYPSTHKHWAKIVPFFEKEGYGIIVPDMLGYGETSKPLDTASYTLSGISRDLVDIIDAENVPQVIVVGHDWGSLVASRLHSYHLDRFIAYAYLVVPFLEVLPSDFHFENQQAEGGTAFGYNVDLFGYWNYLASPQVDKDFRDKPETFVSIVFPHDPITWQTHVAPKGAIQETFASGFHTPLPSYLTEDEAKDFTDTLLKNGLHAPGRWFAAAVEGIMTKDDTNIPDHATHPPHENPIIWIGALHDYILAPDIGHANFASEKFEKHNITIREIDGDHWIILSHADQINRELKEWIETHVLTSEEV